MKLYQAGETSVGICETCQAKVTTRMVYRDYTPSGWDVTVPDVLVAVCDQCGNVVAIPHQSTPKINQFRKDQNSSKKAVQARIPRAIEEALDLVAANLGGDSKLLLPAIIRYYLNLVAENPDVAEQVKQTSLIPIARGKADRRIAIKIPQRQWNMTWTAAKHAGIANPGQLLRGLGILAADDFEIQPQGLQSGEFHRNPKAARIRSQFLRTMAKVF